MYLSVAKGKENMPITEERLGVKKGATTTAEIQNSAGLPAVDLNLGSSTQAWILTIGQFKPSTVWKSCLLDADCFSRVWNLKRVVILSSSQMKDICILGEESHLSSSYCHKIYQGP